MIHAFRSSFLAVLLSVAALTTRPALGQEPVSLNIPAPELQGIEEWINTKPTTLKDLKGRVVVLHFWTFG
jgi:hypothetical protein